MTDATQVHLRRRIADLERELRLLRASTQVQEVAALRQQVLRERGIAEAATRRADAATESCRAAWRHAMTGFGRDRGRGHAAG